MVGDFWQTKMNNQSERVSYSHGKRTKGTMIERINAITTKKIELRILAAIDSCFGLVMPRQHGMARTLSSRFPRKNNKSC